MMIGRDKIIVDSDKENKYKGKNDKKIKIGIKNKIKK